VLFGRVAGSAAAQEAEHLLAHRCGRGL